MSDFDSSTFDYNRIYVVMWVLSKMVIPPEKSTFYDGKSTPINFPLVFRLRAIFLVYPIR